MAFDLKSYENQAKLSVFLGFFSLAAAIGVVAMLGRNFSAEHFYVTYSSSGLWFPMLGAGMGLGLLAGAVGFFVGLNSAGQRRNNRSSLSWQGFFLNAGVITILMSAAIFFFFTRNNIG